MKHLKTYKIFESVDKFSTDFVNLIKDICLDLTDIDYKVEVSTGKHSQMSTDQGFNRLKGGDKIHTDALKINVDTNREYDNGFDTTILQSTLYRIKDMSSEFNFLVDVYVLADDEFISVDDAIDLCLDTSRFPLSDYSDITIIIY